jgi:hypothetical protein
MRMDLYQGTASAVPASWDKRKGASAPEVLNPALAPAGRDFHLEETYAPCNFRPEYADAVYSSGPS